MNYDIQKMLSERIVARRVTLDEFLEYMGGLEYLHGRIVTGLGVELFVGEKQFADFVRSHPPAAASEPC